MSYTNPDTAGIPSSSTPGWTLRGIWAQITTMAAGVADLGSATSADSHPVVIASDQAAIPIKGNPTAYTAAATQTITAGGTAQTALASNAARKALIIQNLHASEDLWFNDTGTAVVGGVGCYVIGPGQLYEASPHAVTSGAISVIAATIGHKFTAKQA